MDETGKPLYGDVFGTQTADFQVRVQLDNPAPASCLHIFYDRKKSF